MLESHQDAYGTVTHCFLPTVSNTPKSCSRRIWKVGPGFMQINKITEFIQVPGKILAKFWAGGPNEVEYDAGSSCRDQIDMRDPWESQWLSY